MKRYLFHHLMDFAAKKPTHIFALAILVVAFAVIILLPMYSFFNAFKENIDKSINWSNEFMNQPDI